VSHGRLLPVSGPVLGRHWKDEVIARESTSSRRAQPAPALPTEVPWSASVTSPLVIGWLNIG
jgi:hypothetical protein